MRPVHPAGSFDDPGPGGGPGLGVAGQPAPGAAALPGDTAGILAALRTPTAWVGPDGTVIWSDPAIEALRVVARGTVRVPDVVRMIELASREGRVVERDLTVRRPGRRHAPVRLRVRVAPMSGGSTLLLVEDISEAERLDHVRRDFVANVSHELKTPIGALSLLAEAVVQGQGDPEAVERFATRMVAETGRLATLVNDLMDLSRLEGIDPTSPMNAIDVDAVVAQACDDARVLAQGKAILFRRGGATGLRVLGVEVQLVTAVRNLIVNAINYSPPSTTVAVSTGSAEGTVLVGVTDQGIGIPPAELERIFERFYRVDPARSRDTGGTGLGLSIVKHVCANHGGDCEVWSRVGAGSTFTIRLPELRPAPRSRRQHKEPL